MKKIILILFLACGFLAKSQTNTEISNVLNAKPQSITTAAVAALNGDLITVLDLTSIAYRTVNISITGTWVGTITFQGSPDNFTTTYSIPAYQPNNIATVWQTTTTVNGSFTFSTVGFKYVRVRMTAYTSGTTASVAFGFLNNTDNGNVNAAVNFAQIAGVAVPVGKGTAVGAQRVAIASEKTYRASTAAVLIPAVTANVPFFCIYGSSTKTIRVQKIIVEGLTLTAVQYLNIGVAKYSTAPSGGTITTFTQIPLDASDAAGTASLVQGYTAVPTTGTRIGFISGKRVMGQATTAAAAGIPQELYFEWSNGQDDFAPVLRGTAQGIGLEWIGTVPASTVSLLITIEWTEE